jgi:hypothetical protein
MAFVFPYRQILPGTGSATECNLFKYDE